MPSPPYLDPTEPVDRRVGDLLGRMTLAEKAGQLFHTMVLIGPGGTIHGPSDLTGLPGADVLVGERSMTHFTLLLSAPVAEAFSSARTFDSEPP